MLNFRLSFDSPGWLALLGLLPVLWWFSFRSLAALGNVRRVVAIAVRSIVLVLVILALAELQWRAAADAANSEDCHRVHASRDLGVERAGDHRVARRRLPYLSARACHAPRGSLGICDLVSLLQHLSINSGPPRWPGRVRL